MAEPPTAFPDPSNSTSGSGTPSDGPLGVGDVLQTTLGIYGRNFVPLALLALATAIPALIIEYYSLTATRDPMDAQLLQTLATWVSNLMSLILGGAIAKGVYDQLCGRPIDLAASVGVAMRRFFPLFFASILVNLMIGIGAILLIIPGLIAATALCVVTPVIVVEKDGPMEALGRSADLTRGYRLAIFGLGILAFLLIFVPLMAVVFAGEIMGGPDAIVATQLSTTALGSVFTALLSVTVAVLYYRLRELKDGIRLDDLAAVFE